MSYWMQVIALAALVGTALVGGLLFAFSVCVMKALAKLEAAEGIRAMQEINRVILNPLFLLVFIGSAILSVVLLISKLSGLGGASDVAFMAALLYVFGVFVVTAAGNVPLNKHLDAVDPEQGVAVWKDYLDKWVFLNHVRTVACTLSVACYGYGFLQS